MENNENKENNPEIKDCYSEAKLLNLSLFTRICGRNPVPGVRQAGDISTLLQF